MPMVKARDAWSVVLFFDPLAIPLAREAARRGVSPTAITLGSVALSWATALTVFFAAGTLAAISAALGYYLSFLLDCIDGKVARLRGLASPRGAVLDLMGDAWKTLAFSVALLYRAMEVSSAQYFLIVLFAVIGLETVKALSHLRGRLSNVHQAPMLDGLRPRWLPKRFATVPTSIDVEVLLYGLWLPLAQAGLASPIPALGAALIVAGHLVREASGTTLAARGSGRP